MKPEEYGTFELWLLHGHGSQRTPEQIRADMERRRAEDEKAQLERLTRRTLETLASRRVEARSVPEPTAPEPSHPSPHRPGVGAQAAVTRSYSFWAEMAFDHFNGQRPAQPKRKYTLETYEGRGRILAPRGQRTVKESQ